MGRILTILQPFELQRPGTGRGPAKPRVRGSGCERLVRGILSPHHTICAHLCDESEKITLDAEKMCIRDSPSPQRNVIGSADPGSSAFASPWRSAIFH